MLREWGRGPLAWIGKRLRRRSIQPGKKEKSDNGGEPGRLLFQFPGVSGAEEFGEVAFTFFGDHFADLLLDQVFVARDALQGAEDADGGGETGHGIHARKGEGIDGIWIVLVMHQQIFFGDAISQGDYFEIETDEANSLVAILAEDQRLAVFELDDLLASGFFFGDGFPSAVVENIAVLQDFDVGGTLMRCWFPQGFFQVLLEDVHGARDESGFGTERERERTERAIHGTEGRGFGLLADFRCGRVLAFGEAVNFIVEHQDFEADVAAQHVNGVVAADGERVAVAGGYPYVEIGADQFHAGGDGGRAAVDGVETEGVHVIREAAGAADAGDEDEFLARDAEFSEDGLNGGEDGVIAAAGAPADFLVGLEIFFCVNRQRGRGHFQSPQRRPPKGGRYKFK